MKKRFNIIFDIDGIMSNIWTSAETYGYADNLIFRKHVSDYEMSTLPEKERKNAFKALLRTKNYEFPLPMPKTKIPDTNWFKCDHIETTNEFLKLTDWADFLKELSENHNITLHTHCMTPETAIARLKWFKKEIASKDINMTIDIGDTKSTKPCDILFEDSLLNILRSDAKCRCMPSLFHNLSTSEHNRNLYENSNKPDFVCMPSDFNAYRTAIHAAECYLTADTHETDRIDKFSETFKALWKKEGMNND